ncbi:MAG: GTPase domain-containing protein [Phycisphaerales bacterium]|nr:GTPase domain-containing protein [Phycisphaerales bacterium]
MSNPQKPNVAITGLYQVGKSTLINCLMADTLAEVGNGLPTSHSISRFTIGAPERAVLRDRNRRVADMPLDAYRKMLVNKEPIPRNTDAEFVVNRDCLANINLWDTPGLDSTGKNEAADTTLATKAIEDADFLIVVVPNEQLKETTFTTIKAQIKTKPCAIVMNCKDSDPESDPNRDARQAIASQLKVAGLQPVEIQMGQPVLACNLVWYWLSVTSPNPAVSKDDKSIVGILEEHRRNMRHYYSRRPPEPSVEELRRKSHLEPLRDFLLGDGWSFRTIPTISALDKAFHDWQHDLFATFDSNKK